MATRFDVDFSEALRQLAEFQLRMSNMGHALDNMEKKSGKPATAAKRLLKDVSDQFDKLEVKLKAAGAATEELGAVTQSARMSVSGMLSRIAADNLKLTVQTKAYSGSLQEVERLLADSSAKSSFVKWAERTRNLSNELSNENKYLSASLKSLDTAEGRHNEVLKASLAVKRQMVTQDIRQQAENLKLQASEAEIASAVGKSMAIRKAKLQVDRNEVTEATRLVGKLGESRRAYDGLSGGLQGQIALQQAMNQGLVQAATFRQREQNQVDELRRRHESLNGGLAEQAAQLRVLNAAREKEVTELTRERAKVEELTRTLSSLNGGEQELIARLQAKIAARRRAIQTDSEAAHGMEELSQAAARELVAEQRLKSALEARNRATMEEARALQQMTRVEAEAIARAEALAAANKKQSDAMLDEARKAHGMSKAQLELTSAREREIERLGRLRAQKDLLNTAYGRELAAVQRQIQEQQSYNRLLTMSTTELLGFTNAQNRANAALQIGSQSAAMMRAGLSGLHTNIGMYTSSTILAASSTYALASALRSTVSLGAEFTATMGRADAVMSTGGPTWLPSSMEAMEGQVRALGQSTIFTASEVAQGLVELGQAGLSASEAILSLKPSLDLAMIGNISMGRSADIATNVMMTFGMQAKDLGEVVDIMAQAVSASNTDIEQLSNALTYAGPAAHTAGISLKDTVAAIEALSNTGIKASKAGTGLRRLFVSLLNPTQKGSAMLDKYGISVTDVEGNTRSLIDILGQLNKALHSVDVSEGERLGAIQDLVGVYATSPVAALVGQAGDDGNLEQLRRQLDAAAGAAERMREKIENSLKYDWKQVVSAYEEAQLQLFDANEYRLREMSAQLTKYLIDLTQPFKEIQNEDGTTTIISNLDMLIQKAMAAGEALAYAFGGMAFSKLANSGGNLFGALRTDAGKLAPRMEVLAKKMADTAAAQSALSRSAAGTSARLQLMHGAATVASGGVGVLAVGANRAAIAIQRVGTAANILMRGLGWVGLIYGIGSAIASLFATDHEEEILGQKGQVDKLKQSYQDLQKAIDDSTLARERAAINAQIGNDQQKIGSLTSRNMELQKAATTFTDSGVPVPLAITDEIKTNEHLLTTIRQSIDGAGQALAKLRTSQTEVRDLATEGIEQATKLAELSRNELAAKEAYNAADGRMRLREKDAWDAAQAALQAYKATLVDTAAVSDKAARNAATMMEVYQHALLEQQKVLAKEEFDKTASSAEKLLAVQQDIAAVEAEIQKARENDNPEAMNRRLGDLLELKKTEQELQRDVKAQAESLKEARRALDDYHRSDEENLVILKKELAEVVAQRAIYNHLKTYGSAGLADQFEVDRLKKELKLLQEIARVEGSVSRKNKGGKGDDKAKQELKAAESSYDALRKKFDPVGASADEVKEKTAQLDLLLSKGKITAEEKAKALTELAKAHYQLTLEQDKNYKSLQGLRDSYGHSPFSDTLDDLTQLNLLLKKGAVSLEEYGRISKQIQKQAKEDVLSGAPTAPTGLKDSGSTPFGEWASTEMERAQGLSWYATRKTELNDGYALDTSAINTKYEQMQAQLEAEQLQQEEHARRLLEIEEQKNQALLSSQQQFTQQSKDLDASRVQYAEQAGKMAIIAMMGSAESILGQFASVADGATTAQKAAFVAQKALAIAQILMYTHLAAAQAMTIPGDPMKIMGMPLASFIIAQGYASAGLVGGLAIGQLAGGGDSYAGAFDKGGNIPYGQWGIVGEYGPEIVQGPAHVTGREATARKLGGGGDEFHISLAPQIIIQDSSGSAGADGKSESAMRDMANMLKAAVVSTLKEQMRPNGVLDMWIRSLRRQ